jgi:uncharacterized protein (DUF4415 family)
MSASESGTTAGGDDLDEVPELDRAFFEGAQIRFKGHVIREATGTYTQRGRPPPGSAAKVQQSLRLSPEVLDYFRSTGPGWQARIDEVLRIHVRMVEEMRRYVADARAARAAGGDAAGEGGGERRVADEREAWHGEGE